MLLVQLTLCWDIENTRAMLLPAGYKHKGQPKRASGAACIMDGEVCGSLELAQNLPLDTMPSYKITLTLDNCRISKMSLSDGPVFMGASETRNLEPDQ